MGTFVYWFVTYKMTKILRLARRNENSQNIAEHALTLAVILLIGAGSIWFIVHAITSQ